MRDPKTIVITGGSSGIGAALARLYAQPGRTLYLTGRNAERLEAVAEDLRGRGAAVETACLDVTDRAAMARWLAEVDARTPVDLAVANAGVSGGTAGGQEDEEQARAIFAVDLDGVLNTIHPLIAPMAARRRGQLALVSSLAAFRGYAGAPAYCAAKAAVRVYGESLRGVLRGEGVEVTVVCPGFVKSRMTDANDYRMPMLMETDRAARIIARGLARNKARIAFPWPTYFGAWLAAALPPAWVDPLIERMPRKGTLAQPGSGPAA